MNISQAKALCCAAAMAAGGGVFAASAAQTNWISSLDLGKVVQHWGKAGVNKSLDGTPLRIGGEMFTNGFGTYAESYCGLDLKGKGILFTAKVGADDEVGRNGTVIFKVEGDGKVLWESAVMRGGDKAKDVSVNVEGVKTLVLHVEDAGDGVDFDHADWALARIVTSGEAPSVIDWAELKELMEPSVVLTPKAPATPRINGAKVFGVRPGSPFMFTIAATGNRPMTFSAKKLPSGLKLDAKTGRITGTLEKKGGYVVTLGAKNAKGSAERNLKIVCGDQIALTPPMGWNSWNCFAEAVSADKVYGAANAMATNGLLNHGWTYVNIDDCWESTNRSDKGVIGSNEKFPDMKALTDHIHSLGLKAGIYSSPGPRTCAGFLGSYQHEEQDAQRYAEWGFDYLKYDWCSYFNIAPKNPSLDERKKPYQVMRSAFNKVRRDIVYSLCQYGEGSVWEWGAEPGIGGNCWRTTGDITDDWASLSGIGFNQAGREKFAGPGHWNDPDMLIVGRVGWGAHLHPTRLTANEQYTHISLWCLLASPLLIGCDMTQMDEFTLSLLTNDEVLEVNQDPLGRQAGRVSAVEGLEVWAKDMEDGSKAVGLFNRNSTKKTVTAKWSDLGLSGKRVVRDLWRQKDVGTFDNEFSVEVPRRGVVLVKIAPAK